MAEWNCRWKPFWIAIGDTFQKAYLGEWQLVDDGSKRDPAEDSAQTVPCASDFSKLWKAENRDCALNYDQPLDTSSAPKSSWQAVGVPDAPTWKLSGTQSTSASWEKLEAPLPHQKQTGNFSKMCIILTLSMMLHRHFLLLPIRQGYEDRRTKTVQSSMPHQQRDPLGKQPDAPTWKLSGTQGSSAFWEKSEAPLPLPKRRCNFIHPKQLSPFPERLELPFPEEEILSSLRKTFPSFGTVLLRG